MKKITLALAIFSIFVSGAASPSEAKRENCTTVYKKHFIHGPKHRAIATSKAVSPLSKKQMSCGWGTGFQSKSQAISRALRECNAYKHHYDTPGICRIFSAE